MPAVTYNLSAIAISLPINGILVANEALKLARLRIHVTFAVIKKHFVLVLSYSIISFISGQLAFAQDSVIDLTQIDFEKQGLRPISGNWRFYWNQLLTPGDFLHGDQRGGSLSVPGAWNRKNEYPALGFATYRVRIKLPALTNGLAIYFPVINSSARIWINGEEVAETGQANSNENLYKAKLTSTIVEVPPNHSELDLIIQVVNYTYFYGGFSGTPQLGKVSQLMSKLNQTQGIDNFLAGSLIAMFIYQLILYSLFNRGKAYLWLSLICFGVAIRALIVHGGSFLLPNLFPFISWEIWKKIEFECVYAMGAFFPLYIHNLFKDNAPKWPIRFFIVISLLLCSTVLITPQYIYGQMLEVSHVALLLGFVYAIYSVGKAWKKDNKEAGIIFFGVLAAFPFILTEILKNSLLSPINIQFMHLVEIGVLVFLLFQVYLLASHYANSYQNLESLNQDLEKKVIRRTNQLLAANRVKDRLLSIVSHDIKSPLNSLRGILNIYNKGSINAEEFKYYSKRIEDDLIKTGLLVDSILYWTASQLKGAQPKFENIALKDIVRENIDLFQTIVSNKRLTIKNDVLDNHLVSFDRNILNLSLRNLLSNAIKFSREREEIIVHGEIVEESTLIKVIDFGVGMNKELVKSLQESQATKSSLGTENEKGTGLGLSFCREYLQMIGGELLIESTFGKGSTFTISIPHKHSIMNSVRSKKLTRKDEDKEILNSNMI